MKLTNIIKNLNEKYYTYYLFDGIINKKDFDPNNIKTDKKSYKMFLFFILDI